MLDPSTSPPSDPASGPDLLTLDADGVHRLFVDLGFPWYREQLIDHGITGDVLIHLDHSALKDVGIHSVGQRLAILRAVYDLKVRQNVPIEEGGWVPPSEEWDLDKQYAQQQVLGLLNERDHRILSLEHEVHNLHAALANLREETLSIASRSGAGGGKPRPSIRSPTAPSFPHPLSNASTLSRSSSTPSRPRNLPPVATSAALAIPGGGLPDSPASPIIDSPRLIGDGHGGGVYAQQQLLQPHLGVGVGGGSGEFSINGVATPTTPTAPMLIHPDSHAAQAVGTSGPAPALTPQMPVSANPLSAAAAGERERERERAQAGFLAAPNSRPSTASAAEHSATSPSSAVATSPSAPTSSSSSRQREPSSSGNTPDNPYRSFRVTLEDPCYKVLPAALKKYKINDDWRLYALFICYGNTERCLAYDEKPLLLFQKLKENNDNPVFMLRHIKDIKSPIAVASAKHQARREKRPPGIGGGVERSLMGATRDGSAPSTAAQAAQANGLQPNARPTRLHHPPVLLPVGKDRAGAAGEAEDEEKERERKPPPSQGYCIAIYPYLAEREDEFDVAVGDTFVILSKTKGWWVVHRDSSSSSTPSSTAEHSPAARRSAWVPAGCLLETSVPPLSLLPSTSTPDASLTSSTGSSTSRSAHPPHAHEGNAASVPILPSYVVSVSTPGICLMDYQPRGPGELEVRKGQPLRILKRYNHWSYAVKDDGGRGWVPSWFCGRANKGDGTPTTPTVSTHTSHPSSAPPSTLTPSLMSLTASSLSTSSTPTPTTAAATAPDSRPSTAPSSALSRKPSLSVAVTPEAGGGKGGAGAGAKSAGPAAGGDSAGEKEREEGGS
ncbi:hypothetical protein JCM10213_005374 [Rhodosporidiobolus nylandii]